MKPCLSKTNGGKNMKKLIKVLSCLGLVLLTGCSLLDGGEFDYADFAFAVADPSGTSAGAYDGKPIEFAAMIYSEPFVMESSEEDINGKQYVYAVISRDFEHYILLNVHDIKEVPAFGEVVNVKGKVDGYIYSTDEGGKEEALNITVNELSILKEETVDVKESESYTMSDETKVTFKRAQVSEDTFGEPVVVVYYEIEMGERVTGSSYLQELELYQGDTFLETTIHPINAQLDANAMQAAHSGLKEGEKALVYSTYGILQDTTTPISIEAYDDNFNLVYYYELPLGE